ncbi:hypothetical protein R80B4_01115 [Fibrobacteres bacterium R8-0-B4]
MASKKKSGKKIDENKKSEWAIWLEKLESSPIGLLLGCILATLLTAAAGYLFHAGWSYAEKTVTSAVRFVFERKPKPSAPEHSADPAKKPANLVPARYTVYKEIKGDLNKDGLDDIVLVVDGDSVGSRSGIIIAFGNGTDYDIALENHGCFSYADVEFGRCGSPGRMDVSIKKGVLIIDYTGGCAGSLYHETYKFRHQNAAFELIGYDLAVERYDFNEYSVITRTESVNLLSKRMQTRTNTAADQGKNAFDEVWTDITIKEPITLQNIETLYDYYVMDHITKEG